MPRRRYHSDLTDAQWTRLELLLPPGRRGGRPRAHRVREIVDALRYVLRGGIAWRALPHDYPPWQTAYHYFRAWRLDGTWERLNDELRDRCASARVGTPSRAPASWIANRQEDGKRGPRGYDGAKKVRGVAALAVDKIGWC